MTIELKFDLENENWINNVDNDFENLITTWIEDVKKGKIYYDGYSKCIGRWRGCFRANNIYWDSLLIPDEEY